MNAPFPLPYDVEALRAEFPILAQQVYGKPLVYLDSAASAQKPREVIDEMVRTMETGYANVQRGLHYMANAATDSFEAARESVRAFLAELFDPIAHEGLQGVLHALIETWLERAGPKVLA